MGILKLILYLLFIYNDKEQKRNQANYKKYFIQNLISGPLSFYLIHFEKYETIFVINTELRRLGVKLNFSSKF